MLLAGEIQFILTVNALSKGIFHPLYVSVFALHLTDQSSAGDPGGN